MIRALAFSFALAVSLALATPAWARTEHPANWSQPTEPFRIIGDIHYVGTAGLSSFLITGPDGHVLIDGGLPSSATMIVANIRKLGFDPREVRYLLINHAHYDHAGGLAELQKLTGAQLVASAADKPDLEAGRTQGRPELDPFPPIKVDRLIRDGDDLALGPIKLKAILTPGHTRGATSWLADADGKEVIFTSSLTVAGQKLANDPAYPEAAEDFRRTFAKLRTIQADVFLNFHAEGFGLTAKRARVGQPRNPFVDPSELARQIDEAEELFKKALASEQATAKGTGG